MHLGGTAPRETSMRRLLRAEDSMQSNLPSSGSSADKRVALAQRLFHEFYAACFWHLKPDLVITEALIPTVVRGLRSYGGQRGLNAAAQLNAEASSDACR